MLIDKIDNKKEAFGMVLPSIPTLFSGLDPMATQLHLAHLLILQLSKLSSHAVQAMHDDLQKKIQDDKLYQHISDKKAAFIRHDLIKFIERIRQKSYN